MFHRGLPYPVTGYDLGVPAGSAAIPQVLFRSNIFSFLAFVVLAGAVQISTTGVASSDRLSVGRI